MSIQSEKAGVNRIDFIQSCQTVLIFVGATLILGSKKNSLSVSQHLKKISMANNVRNSVWCVISF